MRLCLWLVGRRIGISCIYVKKMIDRWVYFGYYGCLMKFFSTENLTGRFACLRLLLMNGSLLAGGVLLGVVVI